MFSGRNSLRGWWGEEIVSIRGHEAVNSWDVLLEWGNISLSVFPAGSSWFGAMGRAALHVPLIFNLRLNTWRQGLINNLNIF